MRVSAIALFGILLFASWNSAWAGFKDGNDVYSICISSDPPDMFMCLGYAVGAADMQKYQRQAANKKDCIPPNATAGQVKDVFVKFLADNPALRNYPASVLFNMAIITAWQCK